MRIEELDYHLPEELIATQPMVPRDQSRLLVYRRGMGGAGKVEHRRFFELPEFLRAGDLMIVNDTKVIPAKLELRKTTGAGIPGLFVHEEAVGLWTVMLRSRGRVKVGDELVAAASAEGTPPPYRFRLLERTGDKGMWRVSVTPAEHAAVVLARIGHVPLPPYIEKARHQPPAPPGEISQATLDEANDRAQYQTVYAREGRSVAAPTAGLHFTPELLAKIDALGVRRAAVNLEVGLGTFLPVETATLEEHPMHTETYAVPAETVAALREARGMEPRRHDDTTRIVVVGTTTVRTLEAAAESILDGSSPPAEIRGSTDLLIQPGYPFRLTDVLVTNFHLPRSTLLALVGALVGLDQLKELYAEAVREKYRFYSYGDAMVVL